MVKAKLVKWNLSPPPSLLHLLTKTQIDQDCLVPVNSLWLGSVHSYKGIEHRAMTALWAVLDAQGMITNHVTPQPVHLDSEELKELQGGSCPGCLAWRWFETAWQGGRLFAIPCHRALVLFPAGWKCAMLMAVSRMIPYVCRGSKCGFGCPVGNSLLAMFWWQALRRGVNQGGVGVRKRELKWWWFGAVSCWTFCGN